MKKILILSAAMLLTTAAMAQSVRSYKSTTGIANGLVYSLPRTSLVVNVTCQKESVRKGPYARFAQKYFGMMAPLADKDVYTITDASINAFEEADPSQVYVLENAGRTPVSFYDTSVEGAVAVGIDGQGKAPSRFDDQASEQELFSGMILNPMFEERDVTTYNESDTGFVRIPVTTHEVLERTLEEQAADIVETIFKLRRRRIDLITGEQGEYVFGAGLGDALKEIDRLEKEYLALFFGKTFKQTVTRSFDVVPDAAKTTVIVCRFSNSLGLMSASDLSGNPIVLEMTPENKAKAAVMPAPGPKDDKGKVFLRVADVVACRLLDGNKAIIESRVPMFQFGKIVEAPVQDRR